MVAAVVLPNVLDAEPPKKEPALVAAVVEDEDAAVEVQKIPPCLVVLGRSPLLEEGAGDAGAPKDMRDALAPVLCVAEPKTLAAEEAAFLSIALFEIVLLTFMDSNKPLGFEDPNSEPGASGPEVAVAVVVAAPEDAA